MKTMGVMKLAESEVAQESVHVESCSFCTSSKPNFTQAPRFLQAFPAELAESHIK